MDPDRKPLGSRVLGPTSVVRARDPYRAEARQGPPAGADDLVPPAANPCPGVGAERAGGEEVRALLEHDLRQDPLAARHRPELAKPPLHGDELVRSRAGAGGALQAQGEPPGLCRYAPRADARELGALGEDLVRGGEAGARILHLLERALRVPRLGVDAAHGILDDRHVEAFAPRVEHRVLDAVVGREAGDEETLHSALPKEIAESRVLKA